MDLRIAKFSGLHFTNNEVSAVPQGAAEDCGNVYVNKFNLLEPRRGFYFADIGAAPTQWSGSDSRKITNHYQTPDAATDFFIRENSPPAIYNSSTLVAAPLLTGTYQDLFPIGKTRPKMVFYNGCSYLLAATSSLSQYGSVYEFVTRNKNQPYLRRAGVPAPASINSVDATGTTFAQNSVLAYTAVFVYLNQGGASIKSAPAPTRQHTINQVSGAKVSITVVWSPLDISPDREAGKFTLQVYRTRTVPTTADTDFKIIKEVVMSEQDLQAGSYTFIDDVVDSGRGEEFYTNDSIGVEPKLQTPAGVDLTLFKDRLWLAGVYDDQPETVITLAGTSGSVSTTNVSASINGKVLCAITADNLIYIGTSTGYVYKWDGTTLTAITGASGVGGTNGPCFSLVKSYGELFAVAQTGGLLSQFYKFVTGTTWTSVASGIASTTNYPQWHSLINIGSWIYVLEQSATDSGPTYRHKLSGWNPATGAVLSSAVVSNTGTQTVAFDCLTAAPRNLVDPTSTDTSKVPVIAYIQDNKPTVSWFNTTTGVWTILYQGAIDTGYSKVRAFYSQARNELFLYAEFNVLGRPRDIWRVNTNGTIDFSNSTAVAASFDIGCSWMGDLNGSHGYGSIKGGGSNWGRLHVTKSTFAHDANFADILYDVPADASTEYLRALFYKGAIISFTWTGTTTLMRSLANGGLQTSDTIVIGGQIYTAGTTETSSTYIIDTVSGSAAVRIAATAKSLVNVINKYNSNCTASYISVEGASVGQILIKGKNGTGASGIYGNKVSPWAPDATRASPAGSVASQQFNLLRFSEVYEPQAFPLVNERIVGAPEDKILRIACTKDTLFVVKQNSVWTVRGSDFTVQLLDNTFTCLAPDSVCVLNNQVYFLSNKGIAVCSDSGVSVEGQQITSIFEKGNTTYADSYGFAVEKYNSYFFILKDPAESFYRKCFVYNAVSQAITKLKFDCELSSGSVVQTADEAFGLSPKIVFHPYANGLGSDFSYKLELKERYSTNSTFWQTDYVDSTFTLSPWGYVGSPINTYQVSGLIQTHTTPKLGDKVVRSPDARSGVVSLAGLSSFGVTWNDGLPDDGIYSGQTFTFTRPISAFYKLAPQYGDVPTDRKHWTSFELVWQAQPTEATTVSFYSDIGKTPLVASASVAGSGSQYENQREKSFCRVPRNAARANALSMTITVPTTAAWSLAAINITFDPGTEK